MLTYDGVRMRVGATSDDELETIMPPRAGARRDLRGSAGSARPVRAI